MDAYSVDLKRKIIDAVEQRMKKRVAGRVFSVSGSSTKRYVKAVGVRALPYAEGSGQQSQAR
jgi:trans-2-enoyl-CoA reductase